MGCKLITFLIFASVAQCFCDQSSVAPAILSEADSANYQEIENYYNTTVIIELTFFTRLFDLISNRIVLRAHNAPIAIEDEIAENNNLITPAGVKQLVSYSVNAASLAAGMTSCNAVAKNIDVATSFMVDGLKSMTEALTLAGTSNGRRTASAIDEYWIRSRIGFLGLIDNIVVTLSDCRSETSAEVFELIRLGQRRTHHRVLRLVDVVFEAMQGFAAAVAEGSVDMRLLTRTEGYRAEAIFTDMSEIIAKFGLIKSVYIYYHQQTDLSTLDSYLIGLNKTDTNPAAIIEFADLADDDAGSDRTIAEWVAETDRLLGTIEKLSARTRRVVSLFNQRQRTARIAVPDAANAVAAMEDMITEGRAVAVKYIVNFVSALISPIGTIEDTRAKFQTLRRAANAEFRMMMNGIAKANDYMSQASMRIRTANHFVSYIYAEHAAVIAAVRRVSDFLSR